MFSLWFLPWETEGHSQFGLVDRTLLVPIATSATAVVTTTGTSSWLAPWTHFLGPSLSFSLSVSSSFCRFFSLSSYLLSFSVPSFLEMSSVPLISFSLSEFVFILTAPLPLCSSYRSISLSSLIQHPPPPPLSLPPCFLLLLPFSCLYAPQPLSLPSPCPSSSLCISNYSSFLLLLLLQFNSQQNNSPFSVLFQTQSTAIFISFCSQNISAAALEANKLVGVLLSWYAFGWAE